MNPTRHPSHGPRGFTLVELLVVIGIIALLISILLPTLARARAQAVSVQCLSNLRQIGQAALMYANENRGQLPIGDGTSTIEKFREWFPADPTLVAQGVPANADPKRYAVRDQIAKHVKTTIKVFFCPANNQRPWEPSNFMASGAGVNDGKFLYWWVANPFDPQTCLYNPAATRKTQEMLVAERYWHQDVDPPVFDASRPCKPGLDFVRKWGEKNAANVAICVDQSRQQTAGWYWMHGTGSKDPARSWKNNLYGDGHAASVRGKEIKTRWGSANPAAW